MLRHSKVRVAIVLVSKECTGNKSELATLGAAMIASPVAYAVFKSLSGIAAKALAANRESSRTTRFKEAEEVLRSLLPPLSRGSFCFNGDSNILRSKKCQWRGRMVARYIKCMDDARE